MVTSTVIDLILLVVSPIISRLPDISIPTNSLSVVLSWVNAVLYFFQMGTVNLILGLMFATMVFRLVVSILKTIWGILPLV